LAAAAKFDAHYHFAAAPTRSNEAGSSEEDEDEDEEEEEGEAHAAPVAWEKAGVAPGLGAGGEGLSAAADARASAASPTPQSPAAASRSARWAWDEEEVVGRPFFHSEAHLFPKGFKSSRPYWSAARPLSRTLYVNEVSACEHDLREAKKENPLISDQAERIQCSPFLVSVRFVFRLERLLLCCGCCCCGCCCSGVPDGWCWR
jgi:hypothetical protein